MPTTNRSRELIQRLAVLKLPADALGLRELVAQYGTDLGDRIEAALAETMDLSRLTDGLGRERCVV